LPLLVTHHASLVTRPLPLIAHHSLLIPFPADYVSRICTTSAGALIRTGNQLPAPLVTYIAESPCRYSPQM